MDWEQLRKWCLVLALIFLSMSMYFQGRMNDAQININHLGTQWMLANSEAIEKVLYTEIILEQKIDVLEARIKVLEAG